MKFRLFASTSAGLTLVSLVTFSDRAYAVCGDMTISNADLQMFKNNPCGDVRTSNIHTMQDDYDFSDDDWAARGEAVDMGNCGKVEDRDPLSAGVGELSKHFSAAMLIGLGVQFTQGPNLLVESMHSSWVPDKSNGDYLPLASGSSWHGWHNWLRHQVMDQVGSGGNTVTFGQFVPRGAAIPDLIQLTCLMYDDTGTQFGRLSVDDPAQRAETIIHEAWHAWEHSHNHPWDTTCGHQYCGNFINQTCALGNECDTWYPHNVVGVGGMEPAMHRPYQAEIEFACDVVDTPSEEVFDAVIELAADDADYLGTSDIVNGPMPACYGFNFGQRYATCGAAGGVQCDQADPCSAGLLCNPGTGCCEQPVCTVSGGTSCDGNCSCDFSTGCCNVSVTLPPPR